MFLVGEFIRCVMMRDFVIHVLHDGIGHKVGNSITEIIVC